MQTRAAILDGVGQEWKVETIVLDPPKAGEVLVELAGSGLCHSEEHLVTGDMTLEPEVAADLGLEQFPVIGGHEGAGVVIDVGPGVNHLEKGDHVVFGFIPSCGRCPSCSTGKQNLCDLGAVLLAGRQVSDMTCRHHRLDGSDLGIMCCVGAFAEHTVTNEASCIKIDKEIPLDKAALVGCGVTTGWGSATYSAEVKAGDTVVIIGCGGVGMNAVQGAAMAGAQHVVAVDPVEFKREQSLVFGATHTAPSLEEATALVMELTWGQMANKAIVTVGEGNGDLIGPALSIVSKGGRVVHTSVAPITDASVTMSLFELTLMQKELVGSLFGSANPRHDIPRLLRMYQHGSLKLDELITSTYSLDEVNAGYQAMRNGENIRGVILHDH